MYWAHIVEGKGLHDHVVVERLAQLIQQLGLLQLAYRSDQESALTSMLDAACRLSGRNALPITEEQQGHAVELLRQQDAQEAEAPSSSSSPTPTARVVEDEQSAVEEPTPPIIAAPELSHPGESASNGAAERAVRADMEQYRCLKLALEENLGQKIPSNHNVIKWVVEHACYTLNRYHVDDHTRLTPYGKLHGREVQERICELGVRIMWYV